MGDEGANAIVGVVMAKMEARGRGWRGVFQFNGTHVHLIYSLALLFCS